MESKVNEKVSLPIFGVHEVPCVKCTCAKDNENEYTLQTRRKTMVIEITREANQIQLYSVL